MLSSSHNQPANTRSFITLLIKTPLVKRLQFTRLHLVVLKATFETHAIDYKLFTLFARFGCGFALGTSCSDSGAEP